MITLPNVTAAAPTLYSASCFVEIGRCTSSTIAEPASNGTSNYDYGYCSNSTSLSTLYLPAGADSIQTQLLPGLICDGSSTSCEHKCLDGDCGYVFFSCTCYLDDSVSSTCANQAISSGILSQIMNSTLYRSLFIVGCVAVGLLLVFCIVRGCFLGCTERKYRFSPQGIRKFLDNLHEEKENRQLQRRANEERRKDEEATIRANEVQRLRQQMETDAAEKAMASLADDRFRLVEEQEKNRIEQERHDLMVAEMKREEELTSMIEGAKDEKVRREAERELADIKLRIARREEERNASHTNIEVVEQLQIENGKVVEAKKQILRKRIAQTETEATQMMESIANDLQNVQPVNAPPSVADAPSQQDEASML
ncbi:hypothetical protein HDU83_003719 [Entophlyctis luteolus]|nr:hypothetical protein HDU82_008372 [Entophlyctis luteolus]KAJ3345795.1 hypothetical protein HDU83_003719 [Entophlyctis luteolus]